jgi:outer membrane protein assembly factor BamB
MVCRLAIVVHLVWLGTVAGSSRADVPLTHIGIPGETSGTGRRLTAVESLVAGEKWSEATQEYLRILEEAGDDLVPVEPRHCVQARWLCHLHLADRQLLPLYRERVDRQVKKWWDQAESAHDVGLLRKIVNEAFCSRFADRALDFLGDLAFERGDFEEAEHWWRLLVPPLSPGRKHKAEVEPRRPLDLVFPDPQVDVARVQAKRILVRMIQRDREGLEETLQAYQAVHGKAEGPFAGVKGNYLETLRNLAGQPELLTSPRQDPPWTTFAGDASRQFRIPQAPQQYLAENPPIPLGPSLLVKKRKAAPGKVLTPSAAAQTLAFYPVIAGGQVVVADMFRVRAFDVRSGKLTGRYDLLEDLRKEGRDLILEPSAQPGFRYTLTVADDRAYVRLGNQAVLGTKEPEGPCGDSFLVCLNLRPDREGKLVPQWRVAAHDQKEDQETTFEGSPLVKDGRLYVARARISGAQVATAIECYSAATGGRYWRQDVCETRELSDGEPRFHHHLLTLAGPNIAYCSHSGAIVAVDSLTGRRSWAVRYPNRRSRATSPRDLAPCLCAGGRLFTAPADYDRILCQDPLTGRIEWESPPVEVVHLLGVADGRLIYTTGSRPRGIRAMEAATGAIVGRWLDPLFSDRDLAPFGRGFLAGAIVFWPTFPRSLRLLNQHDGEADPDGYYFENRFETKGSGNLAFGEGCLAIATAEELRVFVARPRRFEPDHKETKAQR